MRCALPNACKDKGQGQGQGQGQGWDWVMLRGWFGLDFCVSLGLGAGQLFFFFLLLSAPSSVYSTLSSIYSA